MDLTAFRGDLTSVVDRLDETGPVRLTKYNATVAEIRSATPEGDRRHLRDILATFDYLNGLDRDPVVDASLVGNLSHLGLDTMALLTELADRHKVFTDDGVTFSEYPEHCLPDSGPLTVDEALARLYFGDDYPEDASDPYAWFVACTEIQKSAAGRGMPVTLPSPNAWDEDESTFVELAISSGHTPQSLTEFAERAMEEGVHPERLADMLGNEPVPADVLAMNDYSDWLFEQFTKTGMPHAEVVGLFRKGLTSREAQNLAAAGVRSADEIERLIADGLNTELALRANYDGLTPDEWEPAVRKIQHLKYQGLSTGATFDKPGILPFRLLAQAADEKVSLVRWDNNPLHVGIEKVVSTFHADVAKRQTMYPWCHIYTDHVLDVGRAGLSPSYITAFGKLMHHHFNDTTPSQEFVATAIEAHKLGLTSAMADAISRAGAKRVRFTPEQLLGVLRAGLADVGTAYYLADSYADPAEWVSYLKERQEGQLIADAFVATVEGSEAWKAVTAAATATKGLFASRILNGRVFLKSIVEKFLAGKALTDHELLEMLCWAPNALQSSYMPKDWREQYAVHVPVVDELARAFDRTRRGETM